MHLIFLATVLFFIDTNALESTHLPSFNQQSTTDNDFNIKREQEMQYQQKCREIENKISSSYRLDQREIERYQVDLTFNKQDNDCWKHVFDSVKNGYSFPAYRISELALYLCDWSSSNLVELNLAFPIENLIWDKAAFLSYERCIAEIGGYIDKELEECSKNLHLLSKNCEIFYANEKAKAWQEVYECSLEEARLECIMTTEECMQLMAELGLELQENDNKNELQQEKTTDQLSQIAEFIELHEKENAKCQTVIGEIANMYRSLAEGEITSENFFEKACQYMDRLQKNSSEIIDKNSKNAASYLIMDSYKECDSITIMSYHTDCLQYIKKKLYQCLAENTFENRLKVVHQCLSSLAPVYCNLLVLHNQLKQNLIKARDRLLGGQGQL